MTNDDYESVENRSELVFLYDTVTDNPNGNPLSASNRPRIDPETGEAIVTDVRFKRYLRDQLEEDGHGVYVRNPGNGDAPQRDDLIEDVLVDEIKETLNSLDPDELDDDEMEEKSDEITTAILDNAADIRLFGATLSLEANKDVAKKVGEFLPSNYTGPVQFSPAKSLNAPVVENEEYNSLTSVIASGEGNSQGGFDLDDHRIEYAMFPFHGVVNENGADDTRLRESDVERLDTLAWRSIKNQTTTRSKKGQQPRFYFRVEYAEDSYHLGDLQHCLSVDEEHSAAPEAMRTIDDITVSFDRLLARLGDNAARIDTVHVAVDSLFEASVDGEVVSGEGVVDAFEDVLGSDSVHRIDVYDEYGATLPDAE